MVRSLDLTNELQQKIYVNLKDLTPYSLNDS
jgi:hypothetical protein